MTASGGCQPLISADACAWPKAIANMNLERRGMLQ
jgi:hypothetical protein